MIDDGNFHLSDEQLLLDLDGELSSRDARQVLGHLEACPRCQSRRGELEKASAAFAHLQRDGYGEVPPANDAQALLKARLGGLSAAALRPRSNWFQLAGGVALCATTVALGIFLTRPLFTHRGYARVHSGPIFVMPISTLTPGATVFLDRDALCAQAGPNNRDVPVAMQRTVLAQYGIAGADTRDYEIDYLVTPALGGAEDIHNLWPHSYSATAWNAKVKDALESRLRERVCSGSLDLETAQREIAGNWIAAYKKYFNTETPLLEHEK